MSANSKIEWCHHTFNLAWGCVKSTGGCDNCYAERLAHRYGFNVWGKDVPRRTFGEKHWREPLKWATEARAQGVRHRVFSSSMTDNFLNDATIDAEREKLWPLIGETPELDWLLLTKHPERFRTTLPEVLPKNVWLGVTVESGSTTWRMDMLRGTHASVRFLSIEPFIGELDLFGKLDGIDWVIVGGESGHGARPMDLDWARSVRDACVEAGVPFFLKQLGGARDKRGGDAALLDGRRWTQVPVMAMAS